MAKDANVDAYILNNLFGKVSDENIHIRYRENITSYI